MRTFHAAVEAKDTAAMEAVLHPDVVFHSPAVFTPYDGRDTVMGLLQIVLEVLEDFRYIATMRDGDDEVLRFTARVGGRDIEGVDLLSYDANGRVVDLTVMIRPQRGLLAVVDAMSARLAARD